jgi:hypothetical protein
VGSLNLTEENDFHVFNFPQGHAKSKPCIPKVAETPLLSKINLFLLYSVLSINGEPLSMQREGHHQVGARDSTEE